MPPTKVDKRHIKHGYLDKNVGFIKLDRLLSVTPGFNLFLSIIVPLKAYPVRLRLPLAFGRKGNFALATSTEIATVIKRVPDSIGWRMEL
jgi:hypothetical protein